MELLLLNKFVSIQVDNNVLIVNLETTPTQLVNLKHSLVHAMIEK